MIKRTAMLGAAIAAVGLSGGAVAPAIGSSGDDGSRQSVSFLSTTTEEGFVDAPPRRKLSLGDAFIFTSRLTKQGTRVGNTGVVCTIISAKREESQCVGSARLRAGQITIQGLLAGESQRFSFPITGGSGAYEGAEGTLHVRELSGNRERLTFSLLD